MAPIVAYHEIGAIEELAENFVSTKLRTSILLKLNPYLPQNMLL